MKVENAHVSHTPWKIMKKLRIFAKAHPIHLIPKVEIDSVRKDIIVEDLSEKLIPVFGTEKFAVMLYNVLSPKECSELIQRAEEEGFEDDIVDGPGGTTLRNCQRSIIDDRNLADDLFERVMHALKGKNNGLEEKLQHAPWMTTNTPMSPLNAAGFDECLRFSKYEKGNYFAPHHDNHCRRGLGHGDRAGEVSHVTVKVYLNDKFKDGTTRLKGGDRFLDVVPKTGSILLIDHDILHEIYKVTKGQEYIIRTDVMYSARNPTVENDNDLEEDVLAGDDDTSRSEGLNSSGRSRSVSRSAGSNSAVVGVPPVSDSAAKASILKTETDAISIQLSLYHTHKEAYVSAMGEAHYNNRVAQLIDSLPNVVQNRLNVDDVDLEPL